MFSFNLSLIHKQKHTTELWIDPAFLACIQHCHHVHSHSHRWGQVLQYKWKERAKECSRPLAAEKEASMTTTHAPADYSGGVKEEDDAHRWELSCVFVVQLCSHRRNNFGPHLQQASYNHILDLEAFQSEQVRHNYLPSQLPGNVHLYTTTNTEFELCSHINAGCWWASDEGAWHRELGSVLFGGWALCRAAWGSLFLLRDQKRLTACQVNSSTCWVNMWTGQPRSRSFNPWDRPNFPT